jgi:hypothetical protein
MARNRQAQALQKLQSNGRTTYFTARASSAGFSLRLFLYVSNSPNSSLHRSKKRHVPPFRWELESTSIASQAITPI